MSTDPGGDRRRAGRIYERLLRLYPEAFREAYGRDALELFLDRWSDASGAGTPARARFWVGTVINVVVHGLLERLSELRSRTSPATVTELTVATLRRIRRGPVVSATVVLTLGVGIGANVALFGVLSSVLLRPLPYPEADRLVQLWETNPEAGEERTGPSPWNFVDWEAEARGFESMAAWYLTSGTYRTDAWVEEVRSAQVTPDFFRTLGVRPMLGRDFQPEEVERYGPVMLSHRIWSRLFGEDPSVVGRTIVSSGSTYTIVGVMPPDFAFPDESVETWIAWDLRNVYATRPEFRGARFLRGVGRIASGTDVAGASDELARVAAELERRHPEWDRGWSASATSLREDIVGGARGTLWIAFGAVLSILLIACANVANLLLSRVPARATEMGLRGALGASRRRLVAEVTAEHVVLGLLAGAVGLVVGSGLLEALVALDAGRIPRLREVSIDRGVFAFGAVIALLTTVLFGGAPLVQLVRAAGTPVSGGWRSTDSRRQRRLRERFVTAQLGVALVLLVGAGLFGASLNRLAGVDPGIVTDGVATFRVSLDRVDGTAGEIVRYYEGLEAELRELPGVTAVGATQALPLSPVTNDFRRAYRPVSSGLAPAEAPTVAMRIVTAGYFGAVGMTLLEGTAIPPEVRAGEPLVAVVNRTLAARLFGDEPAVGRTFEIDFREGWQPYRVVGVVDDVRHYGPRAELVPEVFLAHTQVPYLAMTLAVRTTRRPEAMFDELRTAVLSYRATQPAHAFATMDELLGQATAEERFLSVLLGVFAGIGLLLAGTGVYAVIAYSVNHRTREIGVRMALGADQDRVVRSVLRDVVRMGAAGLAAGAVAAVVLAGPVRGLLYDVSVFDPATLAGVVGTLGVVTILAGWLPARRAAAVAPSEALRSE